jgi:hypothetical protein
MGLELNNDYSSFSFGVSWVKLTFSRRKAIMTKDICSKRSIKTGFEGGGDG